MNITQPSDLDFQLTLQTEDICLRPMQASDFSHFKLLVDTAPMWKYFTHNLSDDYQLRKWIEDGLQMRDRQTRIPFTVVNRHNKKVLGATSFGNISERDKRIEIGWTWIGKGYQGTGINDQMKYLMLKYCFEALDFERAEAKTDVLNMPARKALSRIGMLEEGVLRSHTLMSDGRRRDTLFYSILKSEWMGIKTLNSWT